MIHLLLSLLGILLTIFFVIGTHETAHFIVARLSGVHVCRFSIGFGPALFRWHDKKETEYVFALIPLGGYVKMLDTHEGNVPQSQWPLAFDRQALYKKFLIVAAGPFANIFCAFALYWLIFVIGTVTVKPIMGQSLPHSIAATAGLKAHQEIIGIDHRLTPTWTTIIFRLLSHTGNHDQLVVEVKNLSDGKTQTHTLDLSHWQMNSLTPDPLGSLGIVPYEPSVPLVIGTILSQSPAATSLLRLGDKIIAVNRIRVKNWNELTLLIMNQPDKTIQITVERRGQLQQFSILVGHQKNWLLQKSGYLGIGPDFKWPPALLHTIQYKPLEAIPQAFQEMLDFVHLNVLLIGKLLTGKISLQSLGGPITIFESAGQALNSGFLSFLDFLAFLSISIGIINVLPIPGLDGGHLLLQIVESLIRRPIPERVTSLLYRLGFAFIFLILIQALINDVLRW